MKRSYNLDHRLIAAILLLSLCLQSCGNSFNQLIPQEGEQSHGSSKSSKKIQIIKQTIEQKLMAEKGYLVNFYEEDGELLANVRVDESQKEPNYRNLRVEIEQGIDLITLSQLNPKIQRRHIHFISPQDGQPGHLYIFRGRLVGGMEGKGKENVPIKGDKEGQNKPKKRNMGKADIYASRTRDTATPNKKDQGDSDKKKKTSKHKKGDFDEDKSSDENEKKDARNGSDNGSNNDVYDTISDDSSSGKDDESDEEDNSESCSSTETDSDENDGSKKDQGKEEKIKKLLNRFKEEKNYKLIGKALYLALQHKKYEKYIKQIMSDAMYDSHRARLVGYALHLAIQDKKDFTTKYIILKENIKNQNEEVNYIAMGWLEAIQTKDHKRFQIWKKALPALINTKILPFLLNELITNSGDKAYLEYFTFLANRIEIPCNLLKDMEEMLGKIIEASPENSVSRKQQKAFQRKVKYFQGYQRVLFPIPIPAAKPKPTNKLSYKFSISTERKNDYYSDSEEEDAPHFDGVYNLTKHGVFDIYDNKQYYSPMRNSKNRLINNYVTSREEISCDSLKDDAKKIAEKLPEVSKNSVTILCVALRQKDGRIKKFVFTTQPSVYQHKSFYTLTNRYPSTSETINSIVGEVHERKYHLIMAQQAHAEGEFLQFLQERPTRYTHIIAMGCNRPHCALCTKMLINMLGQEALEKLSTSGCDSEFKYSYWLIPMALKKFDESHKYFPELPENVKGNNQNFMRKNWTIPKGKIIKVAKYDEKESKHQQLKEWKERYWKRTRSQINREEFDIATITQEDLEKASSGSEPEKQPKRSSMYHKNSEEEKESDKSSEQGSSEKENEEYSKETQECNDKKKINRSRKKTTNKASDVKGKKKKKDSSEED